MAVVDAGAALEDAAASSFPIENMLGAGLIADVGADDPAGLFRPNPPKRLGGAPPVEAAAAGCALSFGFCDMFEKRLGPVEVVADAGVVVPGLPNRLGVVAEEVAAPPIAGGLLKVGVGAPREKEVIFAGALSAGFGLSIAPNSGLFCVGGKLNPEGFCTSFPVSGVMVDLPALPKRFGDGCVAACALPNKDGAVDKELAGGWFSEGFPKTVPGVSPNGDVTVLVCCCPKRLGAELAGFDPNMLVPPCGGGPAGVVEKLKGAGLFAAGVVEPLAF